jgi:FtsZ-binding cell division protein ZapB
MSDNMNEKYQQHYNQTLVGTLTDTILKSVSYQANIKLANEIIAEQETQIKDLLASKDTSKKELEVTIENLTKELESVKTNKLNNENVRITGLENIIRTHVDTIARLNGQVSEVNRLKSDNEILKRQSQQVEVLNAELGKSKEDYKNLRLIHQGEIDKLTSNYEKLVTELTNKIESLESPSPTKTNKAPVKVAKKTASKKEVAPKESEELLFKDGGSF